MRSVQTRPAGAGFADRGAAVGGLRRADRTLAAAGRRGLLGAVVRSVPHGRA